jgi:Na+-driven multidrug efflux pump
MRSMFTAHASRPALSQVVSCGHCRVLGVVAAMETFAGQAYGAGAYASVGEVLQRGMAISFLCCCAVLLLWQWCAPVLVVTGQVSQPHVNVPSCTKRQPSLKICRHS